MLIALLWCILDASHEVSRMLRHDRRCGDASGIRGDGSVHVEVGIDVSLGIAAGCSFSLQEVLKNSSH